MHCRAGAGSPGAVHLGRHVAVKPLPTRLRGPQQHGCRETFNTLQSVQPPAPSSPDIYTADVALAGGTPVFGSCGVVPLAPGRAAASMSG